MEWIKSTRMRGNNKRKNLKRRITVMEPIRGSMTLLVLVRKVSGWEEEAIWNFV